MNISSYSLIKRLCLTSVIYIFISTSLFAVPPTNDNANPSVAELVTAIQGPGVTITNAVLTRSNGNQMSIFSNGNQAGLAIDQGIVMATMSQGNVYSTNSSTQTSDNMGGTGNGQDPDLVAIDARARFDTVVFEFDVTLDANTRLLLVNYQFASEEYNEYVGTIFNDAFGFFVSGGDLGAGVTLNIARVLDPQTFTTPGNLANFPPVTVNNVNNGIVGASRTAGNTAPFLTNNTQYFVDNTGNTIDIEFDGLTVGLNATLDNLTPGETYHFKMALADVGDNNYDTGVFVNSINGIRAPEVCYEYNYEQNNRVFTQEYDDTVPPALVGNVVIGDPITVGVSIQNREDSEVSASNVRLSATDINASQAIYTPGTVYVTNTNNLVSVNIPDNTLGMTNADTYIRDVPALDLGSLEFFFVNYDLTPKQSSLDMPLYWNVSYTLSIPLSPTQSVDINVSANLDEDIPNCSGGGYEYNVDWDIFNVEDRSIANTGAYNLYTQVAGRPFEFNLVAYDPADLETSIATTAFVAIEMIDARAYQTVGTSCKNPDSAFTQRIWTQLLDQVHTPINVQDAVDDLLIGDVSEFFDEAREDTAFRISYLLDENGTDPIAYTDLGNGRIRVDGFPDLQGRECSIDPRTNQPKLVKKPSNNQLTDQANVACGNASTNGVSPAVLRTCLECLYDANVRYVCSRDNFSIRPEAFSVDILDNDQSIVDTDPSILVPHLANVSSNIASGYKYRYDVNATMHNDDKAAVLGYTNTFSASNTSPTTYMTYFWRPDASQVTTGCKDINDTFPTINIKNGLAVNNQNSARDIGRYDLEVRDNDWTKVDQSPAHHVAPHFDPLAYDCVQNNDDVPLSTITLTNLNVGCRISSDHTNTETGYAYIDNNVTVHPYYFDISKIRFQKGIMASNTGYDASEIVTLDPTTGERNVTINEDNLSAATDLDINNSFVYQNNLYRNNPAGVAYDLNMSVRYAGHLSARGADQNLTRNFAANCYAEAVDLHVDANTTNVANLPAYSYRLREFDDNGTLLYDTMAGSVDIATNNALQNRIFIPAANFTAASGGAANIELNLNFDRQVNAAVNPIAVTFNDFNVSCIPLTSCQSRSNMELNHEVNGTYTIANPTYTALPIIHVYARVHTPRQRSAIPLVTVPFDFEFYCDPAAPITVPTTCNINTYSTLPAPFPNAISPNALASRDSIRWYSLRTHNLGVDGNITNTQTRNGTKNAFFSSILFGPNATQYTYNPAQAGYPYKATMEVSSQPWLIYNRYDPTVNTNTFELEFYGAGNWVGTDATDTNLSTNVNTNTNRRIQW